jgi:hypothetical protein
MKKLTLEYVKNYFKEYGYTLLEEAYTSSTIRMKYRCPRNHVNSMSWSNFKVGKRCPNCKGLSKRFSFEFVKKCFEDRSYELLEDSYETCSEKLKYRCPRGHEGSIRFSNFKAGIGCGQCGRKTQLFDYDYVKCVFENEGYKLLSNTYEGVSKPLKVECPVGHVETMSFKTFKKGARCRKCFTESIKYTYDSVKEAFESIGYELLSKEYSSVKSKLSYKCDKDHISEITFTNFLSGGRCPQCNIDSKKYDISFVKATFEKEGYKVLSAGYSSNKTKLKYECPEGHVGHTTFSGFLSGNRCAECSTTKKLTYEFVKSQFESSGYELLSTKYVSSKTKLKYKCPEEHIGYISYDNFQHGKRCPVCAGVVKPTFEEVKAFVEADDTTLRSLEYVNNRTTMEFMCPKHHKYSNTFDNFKNKGQRCPQCAGLVKLTLEQVSNTFKDAGYTLLSTEYINSTTKLKYKCPEDHIGYMTYGNFYQGKRCPKCAYKNGGSKDEKEIKDFVKGFGFEIEENDRDILGGKELDVYIPSKNLAIEYCGLYWHSEVGRGKDRKYHRNKMNICNEKGIRLITIFEDEYLNQKDIVLSRIKTALGIVGTRIYARKCRMEVLKSKFAREFLGKHHLQGQGRARYYFGLFYEEELVSVMSFGLTSRRHAGGEGRIELKRFCSLPDTVVVGGASKLFKNALKQLKTDGFTEVVSYCDMRWAAQTPVYERIGFDFSKETKYTPHYLAENYTKRIRNQALAIKPEERGQGLTEWQLRQAQGYDRIWDCGHRTYLYKIN